MEALPKTATGQSPEKYPESLFRIRFQDCDPFGHLNNARYLDYFINAREEHLRDHYDLDIYGERFSQRNWVVRSSQVSHLAPARHNEEVLIRTSMLSFSRSSIVVEAVMFSKDRSRILATGWADFRYFDVRSGRPVRHEAELLELFEQISLGVTFDFDQERSRVQAIRKESAA